MQGGREVEKKKKLSEKKEEARTVCMEWDEGLIHVICVNNTTHLAVTTVWGNWRSWRKNEQSR